MSSLSTHSVRSHRISATAPSDDHTPETVSTRPVRRESRLTFGGIIYIVVTLFLAIGAVNSQNNLLFWLFGVAIATLIVSGIFSGNALMKTRLQARAFREVHAGQTLKLHYSVSNRSRFFPLFAALISETPQNAQPIGELLPASIIHIGPGASGSFSANLVPARRGRVTLHTVRLSTRFPFGLMQKSLIFEQPRTMLVLPHVLTLKPDLLRKAHTPGEQPRRRSPRSGRSDEFWGLREYVPGDARRRIAWKHSARRNDLVVVEHAQNISTRVWLWIIEPTEPHDAHETLSERAIAIAASLVEHNASRTTPVGLWYPQRDLRLEPKAGRIHSGRTLRALATIDLAHPASPLIPPPAGARDRVIAIQSGSARPKGAQNPSIIDTSRPKTWLLKPESLPAMLGANA